MYPPPYLPSSTTGRDSCPSGLMDLDSALPNKNTLNHSFANAAKVQIQQAFNLIRLIEVRDITSGN